MSRITTFMASLIAFAVALPLSAELKPAQVKQLETARETYPAALRKAEDTLTSQFDKEAEALHKSKLNAEDRLKLIEILKVEKAAFESKGLLPWSAPMRVAATGYLKDLGLAHAALRKAYDRVIADRLKAKDDSTAEDIRTEFAATVQRKLLATWSCTGTTFKKSWTFHLYSDGTHGPPMTRGANSGIRIWTLENGVLLIRSQDAKDPKVQWLDRCALAPDGATFTAENQKKDRFFGKLDRDAK